jgi:hypothetical protein
LRNTVDDRPEETLDVRWTGPPLPVARFGAAAQRPNVYRRDRPAATSAGFAESQRSEEGGAGRSAGRTRSASSYVGPPEFRRHTRHGQKWHQAVRHDVRESTTAMAATLICEVQELSADHLVHGELLDVWRTLWLDPRRRHAFHDPWSEGIEISA